MLDLAKLRWRRELRGLCGTTRHTSEKLEPIGSKSIIAPDDGNAGEVAFQGGTKSHSESFDLAQAILTFRVMWFW
jgi:hypothetical protein